MNVRISDTSPTQQHMNGKHSNKDKPGKLPHTAADDDTARRAGRLIEAGEYQKALDLLKSAGRSVWTQNAIGVCLLRLGRYDKAVAVFREFILKAGCTWMRTDLPAVYKVNYATALLLSGRANGCVEMLGELNQPQHPGVVRLKAAIKSWEKTMSLWQRFNWYIGRIVPDDRPVTLDYLPGEFDEPQAATGQPNPPSSAPPKLAA